MWFFKSLLWVHERLKCFEQLTQWQDIAAAVKANTNGSYDSIWDEDDKVILWGKSVWGKKQRMLMRQNFRTTIWSTFFEALQRCAMAGSMMTTILLNGQMITQTQYINFLHQPWQSLIDKITCFEISHAVRYMDNIKWAHTDIWRHALR